MEAVPELNPRYIVNKTGKRISVVLRLKDYQRLIDKIQSLEKESQDHSSRCHCMSGLENTILDTIFTFVMPMKGAHAKAAWHPFTVLEGSSIAEVETTMHEPYRKLRHTLIENGVIKKDAKGVWRFTRNHPFMNPSEAASVIAGGSRNGNDSWLDGRNRTLPECGFPR